MHAPEQLPCLHLNLSRVSSQVSTQLATCIASPFQALENRTLDSKREMDILSALDEMKSLKVCCMLCPLWSCMPSVVLLALYAGG